MSITSESINIIGMRHGMDDNHGHLLREAYPEIAIELTERILAPKLGIQDFRKEELQRRLQAEGIPERGADVPDDKKSRWIEMQREALDALAYKIEEGLPKLKASGCNILVVASDVLRSRQSARTVAGFLESGGILQQVDGQDFVLSNTLTNGSFDDYSFDGTASTELLGRTLAVTHPHVSQEIVDGVSDVFLIGHQPYFKSLSKLALGESVALDYSQTIQFTVPRQDLQF